MLNYHQSLWWKNKDSFYSEVDQTKFSKTFNTKEFTLYNIILQAEGIKQYRGEYFVSIMDFNMWMRMAYPELPENSPHNPAFLTEMLWYDMITQIFRQDGGLIRINEDGEVFPDHPFDEPLPCKYLVYTSFSLEFHLYICISWGDRFIHFCRVSSIFSRWAISGYISVYARSIQLSWREKKRNGRAGIGSWCKQAQ